MKTSVFDKYAEDYDNWFEKNKFAYLTELQAIKYFFGNSKNSIEIGAGTGKFAKPLNVGYALEPSSSMLIELKKNSNLKIVKAVAENIPYKSNSFETALIVTTICFVKDAKKTLKEIHRILKNNGNIIIGFVDKDSPLGAQYQTNKMKSKFYKNAIFYSASEITDLLKQYDFKNIEFIQTLFGDYKTLTEIQIFKKGFGCGNFIVLKAEKSFG